MLLWANAAPTETPTPAAPPMPAVAETAAIKASMVPPSVAITVIAPTSFEVEPSDESEIYACVSEVMIFSAAAPPPLTATPAAPAPPAVNDAVTAVALMSALSSAVTLIAPPSVVRLAT